MIRWRPLISDNAEQDYTADLEEVHCFSLVGARNKHNVNVAANNIHDSCATLGTTDGGTRATLTSGHGRISQVSDGLLFMPGPNNPSHAPINGDGQAHLHPGGREPLKLLDGILSVSWKNAHSCTGGEGYYGTPGIMEQS